MNNFVIYSILLLSSYNVLGQYGNTSVVDTRKSPYSKLKSIDLTDVTWTNGFWRSKVDLVRTETIPHLYEVMHDEDQGKSVHNMMVAAGFKKGEYKGNNWQDAWLYKWIEMAVVSYAVTNDESLDRKIDELIDIISKAQEADGYISSNVQVKIKKRFVRPQNHEWYNMGHLLTSAALHHRITGKNNFLDIAIKVADYGHYMFSHHNDSMAHFPINPSIIMGAVELYRETRDPKNLELANMVIDIRGKYEGGSDAWQDRIPLRKETEVTGHAVWNTYLYAGAADAFMESGDYLLFDALDRLWRDLVEHKIYIHGGVSPLYRGYYFRDGDVWKADEVHESSGMDYQLPNAYGYNETCGQVGNFMWNYRMLNITGEARFAEVMEREMYNGFLGSMGQEGTSFFYVNPLRWHGHEQYLMSNSSHQRGIAGSNNIGTCCPTNFSRTLVELQGMLYSKSENAFWVHHYGGNNYDDGNVIIKQKTDFPWDGNVEITIDKFPKNDTIKLRVPEWAEGAKVAYNQDEIPDVRVGEYIKLSKKWKKGDKIFLNFPMKARLIASNPKIEETRNQVAVMRGPVLYALESIDLPEKLDIENVAIPTNIDFKPVHLHDLFHGITVLEGTAKYMGQPGWENTLYRNLKDIDIKDIPVKLIPYYTWANRGISKMSVWMPVLYSNKE
ncbi:MAG: glycoside hydrolase family 127 protein [Cyclobacteriaceae bacterium]|nr:glycoside hydrolase family 127 protein [Cyclobacteriaceae bacterium]